jgi:hypothetical protein
MASPDFRAAAERHYKDGLLLSGQSRLLGADHFFGIAAECAIKAALEAAGLLKLGAKGKPEKPYDQHCPGIWDQYAIAHGGHASLSRLPLPQNNPFLDTWHISDRYAGEGAVNSNALEAHQFGALEALKVMQAFTSGESN